MNMKQRKQIIFYQGVPIYLSTEKKLTKLAKQSGAAMHDLIGHILDITVDRLWVDMKAVKANKTK